MKARERIPHQTWKATSLAVTLIAVAALAPRLSVAAQLTPETARSFDQYVSAKEARANRDLAAKDNFLYIDALPQAQRDQAYAKLHQRQILAQRDDECNSPGCTSIPGGLIHDWIGVVFVPGISIPQALATLQDYDHDVGYYPSEVVKSKLLAKSGDEFRIYLRLKQVQVIVVVLDTEYDIRYTHVDRDHVCARSYSIRVAEVDHPGAPDERDEPAGNDHGFLWRLDSYWRFYQADGGVYIQCDAVSLTRDVPVGLGWLIGSFIEKIPAASLRSTLAETRTALLDNSNPTKENSQ
jgi:hypothetical protein